MKRPLRSSAWAIVPGLYALAAWLLVAWLPRSAQEWVPPNRYEFGLPRVCVPYTPGTDVVSLVPDLFTALAIALVCLVLAEAGKVVISAQPGRHTLPYMAFSVYQFSLVVDVLRKFAWDWYGYLLYFARLIRLSHDRPQPEVLPIPAPWLSLFVLIVSVSVYGFSFTGSKQSK